MKTQKETQPQEQQSQILADNMNNMNLDDSEQAGHQESSSQEDGLDKKKLDGLSEGQVDESCITESPGLKEKKMQGEMIIKPRNL